jgi:CTP synthase (UTP-ammonia lyase)
MERHPRSTRVLVGLIGDYSDSVLAHKAIPLALQHAAEKARVDVRLDWVPTPEITSPERLAGFDGMWCVPGSPYRSMEGALRAIEHARDRRVPFLGTCGGFQHAVIEYARNVLGWRDAAHAETSPHADRQVIYPLECGLLEGGGVVKLLPGSRLSNAYGTPEIEGEYLCRFGLNPQFRAALVSGPLREAATDAAGDLRGVELTEHPFFVATLFQPERAALRGRPVPIAEAFLAACA